MDDPMKEFKEIINKWDDVTGTFEEMAPAALILASLESAIKNYEKAHTEQNSTLSVEVFEGELCPLLQKQQGLEGEG